MEQLSNIKPTLIVLSMEPEYSLPSPTVSETTAPLWPSNVVAGSKALFPLLAFHAYIVPFCSTKN